MGLHDERTVPMAIVIALGVGVFSAFISEGWGCALGLGLAGAYWFGAGFLYSRENRIAHILVDVCNKVIVSVFVLFIGAFVLFALAGVGLFTIRLIQKI